MPRCSAKAHPTTAFPLIFLLGFLLGTCFRCLCPLVCLHRRPRGVSMHSWCEVSPPPASSPSPSTGFSALRWLRAAMPALAALLPALFAFRVHPASPLLPSLLHLPVPLCRCRFYTAAALTLPLSSPHPGITAHSEPSSNPGLSMEPWVVFSHAAVNLPAPHQPSTRGAPRPQPCERVSACMPGLPAQVKPALPLP